MYYLDIIIPDVLAIILSKLDYKELVILNTIFDLKNVDGIFLYALKYPNKVLSTAFDNTRKTTLENYIDILKSQHDDPGVIQVISLFSSFYYLVYMFADIGRSINHGELNQEIYKYLLRDGYIYEEERSSEVIYIGSGINQHNNLYTTNDAVGILESLKKFGITAERIIIIKNEKDIFDIYKHILKVMKRMNFCHGLRNVNYYIKYSNIEGDKILVSNHETYA
jgi:hypothetical protein